MLKLSERIHALRKEKKLTQDEAAKKCEISIMSYCRYERGEREPSASVLWRMADFFDVSVDYLIGRTDER